MSKGKTDNQGKDRMSDRKETEYHGKETGNHDKYRMSDRKETENHGKRQNVRQERDRQSRERQNVRHEGQSRRKERIGLDRLSGRKR